MTARFELAQGDAVAWLRSLPSASVDLVVTDPPYESLEKHRAIGTTTRLKHSKGSSNDWFEIFRNDRFAELFAEVYRVLKRDRHFYLYCDAETMFVAKPLAEAAGFKFWKPLIWDKVAIGMGYHYRARYECILFFEKGKRKLNDLGVADVLTAKRIHNGYPTEKPPEIAGVLIAQSTQPTQPGELGELVVDSFMGAGSTGVAALRAGRRFAGNDLCAEAVEITRGRLLEVTRVIELINSYCLEATPDESDVTEPFRNVQDSRVRSDGNGSDDVRSRGSDPSICRSGSHTES